MSAQSFLITGATTKERLDKARALTAQKNVAAVDTISFIDQPSIGITAIRTLIVSLSRKPYQSAHTAVILHPAETMTHEAQNAFLKTLEEPPPHALLILTAPSTDHLLGTIVSRCTLIILAQTDNAKSSSHEDVLTLIQNNNPTIADVLRIASTHGKSKEEALFFIDQLIASAHSRLTNKNIAKLIRRLLSARKALLANVNPRLTLEHALL